MTKRSPFASLKPSPARCRMLASCIAIPRRWRRWLSRGLRPWDAAFLDIEMPEMRGIDLAAELLKLDPGVRIFFCDRLRQLRAGRVRRQRPGLPAETLQSGKCLPMSLTRAKRMQAIPRKAVYIQTIPSFDVYVDGALFPITSPKPKELLALLVDRAGGTVSSGFAIAMLWEDKPDDEKTKALYRMTLKRLREILAAGGIDFILSAEGTAKHVRPDTYTCDYMQFLHGDRETVAKYNGEYMSEYSWARGNKRAAIQPEGEPGAPLNRAWRRALWHDCEGFHENTYPGFGDRTGGWPKRRACNSGAVDRLGTARRGRLYADDAKWQHAWHRWGRACWNTGRESVLRALLDEARLMDASNRPLRQGDGMPQRYLFTDGQALSRLESYALTQKEISVAGHGLRRPRGAALSGDAPVRCSPSSNPSTPVSKPTQKIFGSCAGCKRAMWPR